MILRRIGVNFRTCRRLVHTNNNPDLATAIAELNKEMESVFGDPPPVTNDNFINNLPISQKLQTINNPPISPKVQTINNLPMSQETQNMSLSSERHERRLTHVSNSGEAQMVDVSSKDTTKRIAIASCKVILGKKVFDLVAANQIAKGDVFSVAKIAGINGAKQTSNLIPLCHNINLTHIRVDLSLNEKDFSVKIEGEASSTGKTGVEMEAMTAVTVAGLTVYDMCKAASKDIEITDVRLEHKSGGKSGEWSRKN